MAISVMTIMCVCVCARSDKTVCGEAPLVSFSSFPVEFANGEEVLEQRLFWGLHIDNDVRVEEIVSCTITARVVLVQ